MNKEEVLKKLNKFNDKINYELSMLGWNLLLGNNKIYEDFTEFTLTVNTYFDKQYKVLIGIQNNEHDFKLNHQLGVAWLDIIEVEDISKNDLDVMKMIFEKVEENLLKCDIPFDSNYKFNLKCRYEENKLNRLKYDLDNLERELKEVLFDEKR